MYIFMATFIGLIMNSKCQQTLNFSAEDKLKYQKILREGRLGLTKQGVYDATMMSVLKRARCTIERTNFECTLTGE